MKQKFLCLLLALTLVLGLAATVSATGEAVVSWTLADGVLTISGAGPMEDYAEGTAPWYGEEVYSVIIEDGVTSIGSNAFRGMEQLMDAVIGRDVIAIDKTAFNDCPSLEDVIFRGNDHIIPSGTFSNCSRLNIFRFAGDMPTLEAGSLATGYDGIMDDIITVQYDKRNQTWAEKVADQFDPVDPIDYYAYQNHLHGSGTCGDDLTWQILITDVSYNANYLVISGTGPMYDYAEGEAPWLSYIEDNHLTVKGLYILPGVTYIGENAFAGMRVRSTGIHGSVREIGAGAYQKNIELEGAYLGANLRYVGDNAYAFSGINYLSFRSKVPEFGTGVFEGCKELTSTKLPEGMTHISDRMFADCTTLREITIPTTATSIGTDAFAGCRLLKTVNYYGTTAQWDAIDIAEGNEKLLAAELEGVITTSGTCGDNAFWALSEDFTTLTISGTGAVTSHPWENAAGRVKTIIVEDGITALCDSAFYGFEVVTEVRLPDTLTEIGDSCFRNNYILPELELPAGLTKLGEDAFTWCSSLKSMVIPEGITAIPSNLLSYCEALESVELPENVTAIGSSAFIRCISLSEINIPTDLTELGGSAFAGCRSLTICFEWPAAIPVVGNALHASGITEVILPDTVTAIGSYAFDGCSNLEKINLPDSVTSLGECCFRGTTKLGEIHIPSGVTTIPYGCFNDSGITSVEIPDTVSTIASYAFHGCTNLESVHLPESVTSIADEVFTYCSSLKEINWPSGVENIGWHQFRGTALTEFTVPATVKKVESYAFKDCTKLEKLVFESKDTLVTGSQIFENTPLLTIYCWYDSSAQAAAEFEMIPYVLFDAPADLPRYQILTTTQGDGTITVTPADSIGFEWITIDVTPASNSVLYDLYIYYYSYEELDLRVEAVDEDTFRLLMPKCDVEIVAVFQNIETGFIDIKSTDFFYDAVLWAVENGITTGISPDRFGPNDVCLRSQVVTFLWRAAGEPIVEFENPFVDVKPTDYYYNAVLWAVSEGITNGIDSTHFRPNDTCNRSQVVTFLHRAAGEPIVRADNPFTDVKTTDYYYDAVLWAAKNGVTNGITPSTFVPFQTCNRSQIVTFLYRSESIPEPEIHSFELINSDPTEETGYVFCEGTEFAAGESVIFYAEPWYGYLAQFEVNVDSLDLYYLGGNYYEFIMPDQDVVMTAHFVPATGDYHHINMDFTNCIAVANCLTDEDGRDIAKAQEFVQLYIVPSEGFTFSEDCITITSNGQPLDFWWYLGSTEDPDIGTVCIVELLMPDGDVDISITCTPGTSPAAAGSTRIPVSVN